MSAPRPAPAAQQGFALVETLVATAIVAVMAAMLFGVVNQDTSARRALADRRVAVAIAQSHLEQAAVVGLAGDLPTTGTDQGFRWRLARTDYDSETNARDSGPPLTLVTVEVAPPQGTRPIVRLQTLQIAL